MPPIKRARSLGVPPSQPRSQGQTSTGTKRRRAQTTWSRVPRNPFPNRAIVKLKYCEGFNQNPSGVLRGRHLYSCNKLYDPNTTGIGHQPLGYDQYAQLYDMYWVKQAWIKVSWAAPNNEGASSHDSVVCALGMNSDNLADARSNAAFLEDQNTTQLLFHNSQGTCSLTKFYDQRKLFPTSDKDSCFGRTDGGTSPAEGTYFEICTIPNGADPGDYQIRVEIIYLAEFFERKDLQES